LDEDYPINLGTFDVQQKGIKTAAKLLESGKSSAVIAAFGDSRTSPHFFSGSGMSTGRLGIEYGAELIRKFNRKEISSKKNFVEELDKKLDEVQEKTIEKGRRFVKPNSDSARMAAKSRILKNNINEHLDFQQTNKLDIKDTGW